MPNDRDDKLHKAPERRTAGRTARVSRDVLRATLEIGFERGGTGLTFEEVAKRANVNRATLYRRWGTPSRFIAWAMLEFVGERVPTPDEGTVEADLVAMMLGVEDLLMSPLGPDFFRIAAVDARTDDAVASAMRDYWEQRGELARAVVARAVSRGELPLDVDPGFLLEVVFGPMYLRVLRQRERLTIEEASRYVRQALAGIRATS